MAAGHHFFSRPELVEKIIRQPTWTIRLVLARNPTKIAQQKIFQKNVAKKKTAL
jgi:hypothetical protein